MSDKGTGSDSGGKGAVGDKGATNRTAKQTMDQVIARNAELEKQSGEKDALIADLTQQLKEANDVLEGQEKSRLIGEIMPRSRFKADELAGKTVDELKEIRATLDFAMLPKVNSVRFGVPDLSNREKNLSVGDLSVVTAARRKAQEGA